MAANNASPAPTGGASTDRVRRPHHKSRTGCRSCKAKRIKCDEGRPACGNCTRRNAECHYFHTIPTSTNARNGRIKLPPLRRDSPDKASQGESSHDSSPSSSSAAIIFHSLSSIPASVGTPYDRLLELRLFHHYQTMSSQSPGHQHTWAMWIASEAISTRSVMDALLGFSAFHMRRLNDNDSYIRQASHKYMDLAIRSHAHQVRVGLNEGNASALIACCALLLFHTSVNEPYLSASPGHKPPVHWFRPFKRAEMFFNLAWPCIADTKTGESLKRFLVAPHIAPGEGDAGVFDFLLDNLEPDEPEIKERNLAYKEAIRHLLMIYYNPGYPKLLRFPTLVMPAFVDLLEAKDPRALAIAGYFFMMIKTSKILWWVDGSAEREFAAVMAHLPYEWWPKMDWAMREFGWTASTEVPTTAQLNNESTLTNAWYYDSVLDSVYDFV